MKPRFTIANLFAWMTVVAALLLYVYIGQRFLELSDRTARIGYRLFLAEDALQEVARSFNDHKTVLVFRKPYESNEDFAERASEASQMKIQPTGRTVLRILLKDPEAARLVACPNLITPEMAERHAIVEPVPQLDTP